MPPPLVAAAALGIAYRHAEAGDGSFLAAVYASTRTEELARTGWPDEMKRQFLAHQFQAQDVDYRRNFPHAERLVIELDGEGVGRLYIVEQDDHLLMIDVALLPGWRGRGIGAAIFCDVMVQARAAAKPIRIHVEKSNPARRLYDRLGFAKVHDEGVYDLLEWSPEGDARPDLGPS
jgi:ribosomal protein S18 acetylase RimI-like enzyme